MLMSLPLAATWQVIATTSPLVWSVACDTALALPAAFVSEAIAPAVAVPDDEAPKAGVAHVSVAAIAPEAEMRKHSLLPAPSSWSTTAFVAASLLAVLCVTAIAIPLRLLVQFRDRALHLRGIIPLDLAGQVVRFLFPRRLAIDRDGHADFAALPL